VKTGSKFLGQKEHAAKPKPGPYSPTKYFTEKGSFATREGKSILLL